MTLRARQLRHEEGIYDVPESARPPNTSRKPVPPPLVPAAASSARGGGGLRIIDDEEELARAEEDESGEVRGVACQPRPRRVLSTKLE